MTFDELKKTWQEEETGLKVTVDSDILLASVKRNKEYFASAIFWRDVREGGLAFLGAVFFLYQGMKSDLWSLYLPALACIFVGAFMIVDRVIQKKKLPKPSDSLAECIRISLAQVEHQIWLLRNILWWYLLPFAVGIALFWGHVGWQVHNDTATGLIFIGGCFVGLIFLYIGIYYLNQYAVRKVLIPRKDELGSLLKNLTNDSKVTRS
jgi:drug/metabolite transporter (DMT)-like permease